MKRMEWAGHGNWLDEGRQEKRHQEWIVFRSAQVCELSEPTQVPTAPSHSSQLSEVTHWSSWKVSLWSKEKGHGRCLCKCWAASEVLRGALKERLLWEPPPHSGWEGINPGRDNNLRAITLTSAVSAARATPKPPLQAAAPLFQCFESIAHHCALFSIKLPSPRQVYPSLPFPGLGCKRPTPHLVWCPLRSRAHLELGWG